VTFAQSDDAGTTTTLELVLPWIAQRRALAAGHAIAADARRRHSNFAEPATAKDSRLMPDDIDHERALL
jgi:hypothetical protein